MARDKKSATGIVVTEHDVIIDGESFPWAVSKVSVDFGRSPVAGLTGYVTVTIPADHVRIEGRR